VYQPFLPIGQRAQALLAPFLFKDRPRVNLARAVQGLVPRDAPGAKELAFGCAWMLS
jgi:hypothetical protein